MATYFFMLSMPALFGLTARNRASWAAMLTVFLVFVFLVGFRYRVGMDWNNYEAIHRMILDRTPLELLLRGEPLSYLIFWASKQYTDGTLLTNVVAAAILLLGVFSLARRTADPWVAVLAATPYLIIVIGMSGIRQAMAAGVFFFALGRWQELTTVRRLLFVFVASLFHASALLLALLPIAEMKGGMIAKLLLGGAAVVVGGYFLAQSDLYSASFEFYENAYVAEAGRVESAGAGFHIALVAIPAMAFLALRDSLFRAIKENRILLHGCVASVVLLLLMPVASTGASRFSIYFQFVPMVVYPFLTRAFGAPNRSVVVLFLVLLHFVVLFMWLNFANNALAYRQYHNIVFSE